MYSKHVASRTECRLCCSSILENITFVFGWILHFKNRYKENNTNGWVQQSNRFWKVCTRISRVFTGKSKFKLNKSSQNNIIYKSTVLFKSRYKLTWITEKYFFWWRVLMPKNYGRNQLYEWNFHKAHHNFSHLTVRWVQVNSPACDRPVIRRNLRSARASKLCKRALYPFTNSHRSKLAAKLELDYLCWQWHIPLLILSQQPRRGSNGCALSARFARPDSFLIIPSRRGAVFCAPPPTPSSLTRFPKSS